MLISDVSYFHIQRIGKYKVTSLEPLSRKAPSTKKAFFGIASDDRGMFFLKLANPENPRNVKAVQRESDFLKQIRHPNIINIVDSGEIFLQIGSKAKKIPYIVTEHMYADLFEFHSQSSTLGWEVSVLVMAGIFDGLQELHRNSIIHSDLNAKNILLSRDLKCVKLADFGEAKILNKTRLKRSFLSSVGAHESLDDRWSMAFDLFSLGSVVYNMIAIGSFHRFAYCNEKIRFRTVVPRQFRGLMFELLTKTAIKDPADRERTRADIGEIISIVKAATNSIYGLDGGG